ncbi:MAG: hypothetical protein ACLQLH_17345 [Terracidiphilus sp.]
MQIPEWLSWVVHCLVGGGAASGIVLAWMVIRRLNRDESLRQDFPPHRHINGKILYPRDYEPAVVERLHGGD